MEPWTSVEKVENTFERLPEMLRVALHSMFAILLLVGVVLSGFTWNIVLVACALGVLYCVGTVNEKRWRPYALWWLAGVVCLWLVLVFASEGFTWLMFPIMLLSLYLLPAWWGELAAFGLWGVTAIAPFVSDPNNWTYGKVFGPLFGTLVGIGIFHTSRAMHQQTEHHRAVAHQLQATQAELSASEHQAGRLEERERLSREIHDTVAQNLSSIVLLARSAQTTGGNLEIIEQQASTALEQARRLVRDLAIGEPLVAALKDLVHTQELKQQALGKPLEISLELVGNTDKALPEPITRALLRTAQEGLANVSKHADARKAVCTLAVWELEVSMDVVDNGRGFRETSAGEGGYGLPGLRKRVEELGGTITVESSELGTALSCHIPLSSHAR